MTAPTTPIRLPAPSRPNGRVGYVELTLSYRVRCLDCDKLSIVQGTSRSRWNAAFSSIRLHCKAKDHHGPVISRRWTMKCHACGAVEKHDFQIEALLARMDHLGCRR